jgi:alpha-L-fucosidase 2
MGANMREGGPVRDEIGAFYVDSEWPTLWLDLNLELTYWPVAPSNRHEGGRTLGAGLAANVANGHLRANAQRGWPGLANASDAANIGAGSNQMAVPGDLGDLPWVVHDVWRQCTYEWNATCFTAHLLPPLRGAVGAYRHLLAYNLNGTPTPGVLHLFPTDDPAGYPAPPGWDASYDIAGVRWAFGAYLDVCDAAASGTGPFAPGAAGAPPAGAPPPPPPPECDAVGIADARRIARDITPLSVDPVRGINVWGSRDGAPVPFTLPFRHFSHTLACADYLLLTPDTGPGDGAVCAATVDTFYSVTWGGGAASTFSYAGVAAMSAYVLRGGAAYGNVSAMLFAAGTIGPSTFDNEGSSAIGNGSDVVNITPEATAAACDVLHSLFLQSHGGRILRVFPALPPDWGAPDGAGDAVFWRLRAERGFLVSAAAVNGSAAWVQVESEAGAAPVVVRAAFAGGSGGGPPALAIRTFPPGAPVSVVPAGPPGADGAVDFNVTGLGPGATVLMWPAGGGGGDFAVTPAPTRPGCANAWGWHPGWVSAPCV